MTSVRERHVLVVNQHGDNRGDEAAMDGMFRGIEERCSHVRFTVVHQFADDTSARSMRQGVEWIPIKLPAVEAVRMLAYLAFRLVGLRPKFVLGRIGRATVAAYESADVVVSAPGGPYFGDIYIKHEPVHWLYVWMAALHRVPCVLYATSAGPFRAWWANPGRRFTYRRFRAVYVREEISADHVRSLFGKRKRAVDVQVSVDAALQVSVPAAPRNPDRRLVVVSAINWAYKGDPDPSRRRRTYDVAVADAAVRLAGTSGADVVFVPQLHGTVHRDAPYLQTIADLVRDRAVGTDITVKVMDENADMRAQRALFASADWVIAGRYHPAVFALSAGVPQLCIPYEHKATGVLQLAGLDDVVLPIQEVSADRVQSMVEHLLANRDDIARRSVAAAERLREISGRTSDAVVAAMEQRP